MADEEENYVDKAKRMVTKINYSIVDVEEIFQLGLYCGYEEGKRDGVNTARTRSSWAMANNLRKTVEEVRTRLPVNVGGKALDQILEKLPITDPQLPQVN